MVAPAAVSIATPAARREREWQLAPRELGAVRLWLREHPRIDALRIEARPTLALHDRYLDTDTWSILRAGFALRVRHDEQGTEATLKTLERASARVDRLETTQPLASVALQDLATSDGPVISRVQALADSSALAVLFEAWTRRERFAVLAADEPVAEIALDESRLGRGDGSEPIVLTRIEIEALGKGHPALPALVAEIRAACSLMPAEMSKFEAGLAAAGLTFEASLAAAGLAPAAALATPPARPAAGMSAAEAVLLVLRVCVDAFRTRTVSVMLGDDPEDLHDLRVAARRLVVALRVFGEHLPQGTARLALAMQRLLRSLGAARDDDVQLADLEAFGTELDEAARPHLEPLRHRLLAQRARSRARMLQALEAPAAAALLERLTLLAGGNSPPRRRTRPLVVAVPAIVRRRYRKLRKAATRASAEPTPEVLHAVRSAAKKLRYAVEPFDSVYGEPVREFMRALRRLQNALGEHQDAHLAAQRLGALAALKRRRLPGETLFVMGQLVERARDRARHARESLPSALRRVRGRRWKALYRAMAALESRHVKALAKARRIARRRAKRDPAAEGTAG